MSSSYSVNKTLAIIFVSCSVLLLLANVRLQYKVAQGEQLYKAMVAGGQPRAGMAVPPLVGYDLNGKKITLDYGKDHRKTLLLVFSPSCHACDANWPEWQRLIRSSNATDERIILANIATSDPAVTADYITRHHIDSIPALAEVSAESMVAYRLQYTPQTILIGSDGRIEKAYTGVLSSEQFVGKEAISADRCSPAIPSQASKPCSIAENSPASQSSYR